MATIASASALPLLLLLLAAVAAVVGAERSSAPGGENGGHAFSADTAADIEFVCAYRSLALEFAQKVQPAHDARLTFDALMLGSLCNKTRPAAAPAPPPPQLAATSAADCSIFVSVDGDDSHAGTSAGAAKATVAAGVEATRALTGAKTLCVGAGTFYLTEPLELTPKDSGLAILGEPNATWLSGARRLPALHWSEFKVAPAEPGTMQTMADTDNQAGCSPGDPTPIAAGGCGCYNESSSAACEARCVALGPKGCPSFAWSGASKTRWGNQCCIHADGEWNPRSGLPTDHNHTAGHWVGARTATNIWKAKLPTGMTLPAAPHLRVDGARSSRARFPNANPETDQWPVGWVPDAQTWLPAKPPSSQPKFVGVVNALLQTRNDGATLNQTKPYSGGIGGPCEVFDPPFSYWCSAHPAGGGGFQFYVPSGMELFNSTFPSALSPDKWTAKGEGATVHAFRRSHWASWMFDVDSVSSSQIKFGKGGYQGCRGGPGQDWFVENVLELLDAAGEHYIDTDTHTLYYQANTTTGPPPADLNAEIPMLQALLIANATQAEPIKGLTLRGVGFRDSAPTYMEPHGVPSGGDWGLERLGAVYLEGTVGLSISGCAFERLDGNALMLSGYHRGAAVTDSHFAYTGGTAIAAWGRTDELSDGGIHGYDATPGDIPQGTRIEGNIMRESGIWEKQSSCFFQAKTAGSILLRNLCYNLPRAGFNFNVRVVCCALC